MSSARRRSARAAKREAAKREAGGERAYAQRRRLREAALSYERFVTGCREREEREAQSPPAGPGHELAARRGPLR